MLIAHGIIIEVAAIHVKMETEIHLWTRCRCRRTRLSHGTRNALRRGAVAGTGGASRHIIIIIISRHRGDRGTDDTKEEQQGQNHNDTKEALPHPRNAGVGEWVVNVSLVAKTQSPSMIVTATAVEPDSALW